MMDRFKMADENRTFYYKFLSLQYFSYLFFASCSIINTHIF
jgi:hypothetical protein